MINQIKQELRKLIIKNREADAIEQLIDIFSDQPDRRKELCIIYGNFNAVISDSRKGTIDNNEEGVRRNKIKDIILDIIENIEDEEAAIVYDLKNTIHEPILIVSKNEAEQKRMQTIFSNHKYRFLEYAVGDTCLSVDQMKKYELLVYNNFPEENSDAFPDLLKQYIELCEDKKVDIPMLYFGPHLRILNTQYKDTVYYANSKFSIHSRIAELLTYLNYKNSSAAS